MHRYLALIGMAASIVCCKVSIADPPHADAPDPATVERFDAILHRLEAIEKRLARIEAGSHLQANVDALQQAAALSDAEVGTVDVALPAGIPENRYETPQDFVAALLKIRDFSKFEREAADPFAQATSADEAVPLLVALLDTPDAETRVRALATLGKINRRPDIVVPAVIPLLSDDEMRVRWDAALTLGKYGKAARPAVPALTDQMNDDESAIATFAAMMLRQIDPTSSTEARLGELLFNPIEQNRERAIDALTAIGTPMALNALVRAYDQETDPERRKKLPRAIGKISAKLGSEDSKPSR